MSHYLQATISSLSGQQTTAVIQALENADIARLLKGTTVNQELKGIRSSYSGKVKRVLSELSKHPNTIAGIDLMFKKGFSHAV